MALRRVPLASAPLRRAAQRAASIGAPRCAAAAANAAAVADAAEGSAAPAGAATERRLRVLSGVQPTGAIHLGNYLGAIKNWVALQEQYDAFFCSVDLHAITVPHDPKELYECTAKGCALYIACGIDPKRSTVFVQSHVSAHSELAWLLNCATPIGWLEKMIQYKEKARKQGENVSVGLLDYPVLMAADILAYQADLVPVGEDQKQHLELTRDIATRVNGLYGGKAWKKRKGHSPSGKPRGGRVFKVPEPLIPPAGARIMSLTDGTAKMSKSAPAENSRIGLLDPPDVIASKVKKCKTDTFDGLEYDNPERPEATNLLGIYELVTGKTRAEVEAEVADMRWGAFKPLLADAVVAHLEPIQQRYAEVTADPAYLDGILAEGAERANEVAYKTLLDCRDAMGFIPPPGMPRS